MASTFLQDHNRLFGGLTEFLNRDPASLLSEANGGKSILFVYPPVDEEKYIEEARSRFVGGYEFVDIRKLFVDFIDLKGLDKFKCQFENMGTEVFVSNNYTDGTFYSNMMKKINEVASKGVTPILIHTGVIYNMGFSNLNIMEEHARKNYPKPLVFFYPATLNNGTIYFLGKKEANKYRCVVVI